MSDEGLSGEITYVSQPYNQGWMWANLLVDGDSSGGPKTMRSRTTVKIVGTLGDVYSGLRVTVLGEWVEHEKFGKQYKVSAVVKNLPTEDLGVKDWLIRHIPHIGEVRATALMETYGAKLWEVLNEDPMKLARDINGITRERVDEIVVAYKAAKFEREERVKLYKVGFTQDETTRLLNQYGRTGRVSQIANDDPHFFYLEGKVELSFARVEAVFMALGKPANAPGRLKAAVVAAFRYAAENGDTVLGSGDVFERMEELLELHGAVEEYRNALLYTCRDGLVKGLGDDEYMGASLYMAEFHIAHAIEGLLESKRDPAVEEAWEEAWAAISDYMDKQEVINGNADAVAGSGGPDDDDE